MNKKGFVSTSVIYTILIVFLLMLTTLFLLYYNSRTLLSEQKEDLNSYLLEYATYNNKDIIIKCMELNSLGGYDLIETDNLDLYIDNNDLEYDSESCNNGAHIIFIDGAYTVTYNYLESFGEQTTCNLYFK